MKWGYVIITRWFSFMGRMGRGDYNSVNLVALALLLASNFVFVLPLFITPPTGPVTLSSIPLGWNAWLGGALLVLALWIAVSSAVRRLHDFGWSGWWVALCLSPLHSFTVFAGVLGMIVLAFFRGKSGPNRYGDRTPPNQLV